ncbi:Helix-turn-helix [Glycomyces sambucus]|uniref:Helix-turn-helix n=2 Tax=Glycomyces sambucus TaxID=380244 RepID=A0A1G9DY80_9ACTN|nr:Helix-turn-helix [Glycomyces sambucus]
MPVPSSLTEWNASTRFRDARLRRNVSQAGLSRELNVSPATIANWEKNRSKPHSSQVEKICDVLGIGKEIKAFLYRIAVDGGSRNIELTPRENALCLALAELHYGSIWKWEPLFVPGIAQTRAYNKLVQQAEGTSDIEAQFDERFKEERKRELARRSTPYRMSVICSDLALLHLKVLEAEERREQVEYLRECNAREGWELRVMATPSNLGGPFSVYVPDASPTAGPPFVYTQIHDLSWCIEELGRVRAYHERIKKNWKRATPLEEFLDAERDRLA